MADCQSWPVRFRSRRELPADQPASRSNPPCRHSAPRPGGDWSGVSRPTTANAFASTRWTACGASARSTSSTNLAFDPRSRRFAAGLLSAWLTRLRLARSRLWLTRRSTALRRCRRSGPILGWGRARCDLADRLHGSGVPGLLCLTPHEFNLILELAHCCLCHRRSSQFSVTIAVVRCRPGGILLRRQMSRKPAASGPLLPRATSTATR
jgi:hypothetical protein